MKKRWKKRWAQPFHLFGDSKGEKVGLTFFHLFLIHHYSMNSCIMWSSKYKKSTYKLNYVGKLENTQSNQQMIHRRPTLQRLCPLSPWVEQRGPQPMAPRLPMVPHKAPVAGFGGAMAGSPIWGAKKRHIKKEKHGVSALSGRQLVATHNSQPIVGGSGRGDVWEKARGG